MGIFREDHLIERLGLGPDRGDNLRMAMAVRNHPPRGNRIQDALSALQGQMRALGAHNLGKCRMQCMLGERMPDRRDLLTAHREYSCMIPFLCYIKLRRDL